MEVNMEGLPFGLIDNGVLIFGAFTGLQIERAVLPQKYHAGLGAVFGAGIGNTVSDCIGALVDPAMQSMVGGITLGCIIPLFAIPVIAKFFTVKD
jgi:hypothetical protein